MLHHARGLEHLILDHCSDAPALGLMALGRVLPMQLLLTDLLITKETP
jgi:hypothetical protein